MQRRESPDYQANRMIGDQGYPAFELRSILSFTQRHFGDAKAKALLMEIGLDESTLQHSQFVEVWQVDYALGYVHQLSHDPEVGVRIGTTYTLDKLDLLLPHFARCDTLRDCLQVVMQMPRLVGSLADTLIREEEGQLSMRWLNTGKLELARYNNIFLHSAAVLVTLARELTGKAIDYSHIDLQVPEFAAGYLKSVSQTSIGFERPYCQWSVATEMLDYPVVYSFGSEAGQALDGIQASLIDAVLTEIRAQFPEVPRLESLAASLNMSDRSLRRKLAAMGTGYQPLVDMVRAQTAIAELLSGRLNINEIAEMMGYVDVSHFRQSFKHWTGHAPGHFVRLNVEAPA